MIKLRRKISLFILILVSVYLTAYTVAAYTICSKYVVEQSGKAYWSSGPAGSLFPWPIKNGDVGIPVLFELSGTDLLIYNYLIKTYLLVIFCVVLWAFTILLFYRQIKS